MSISPNVPSPEESFHYENTGTPRWITVLFVVLFLGVAAVAYVGHTAQSRLETVWPTSRPSLRLRNKKSA